MINPALHVSREAIADFCRRHRIRRLSLFGSAVRSDFGPDSDVDVLVEPAEGAEIRLLEILSMEEELAAIFGQEVDLVTRDAVEQSRNHIRRRHILAHLEPVYVAG
jgi:predicted nucleotidyltransferase